MFWILALSAVVNIALGYALALYLANVAACSAVIACADSQTYLNPQPTITPDVAVPSPTLPDTDAPPPHEAMVGALQQIQHAANAYHDCLTETDQKLRDAETTSDEFNSLLQTLLDDVEGYTRQRNTAHAVVVQLQESCPAVHTPLKNLDSAIQREDSHIAAVRELAGELDAQGDLEARSSQWTGLVGGMLEAGAVVREEVDSALARLSGSSPDTSSDADQPAMDRDAAATRIARWWNAASEETRPLSLALVDLDKFGELNRRHGPQTMDKVLCALTRWLADERPDDGAEGFSGERFLLLFPDSTMRESFEPVERIRQSIERMRFRHDGEDIQFTACCAIVEGSSGDSPEMLLARAEATLADAKHFGRNRTFVHQGDVSSPLIPIEMSIEERQLLI